MKSSKTSIKQCFKEGAIAPAFIAESIAKHQHKTGIGAHDIFLGQVRADKIGEQEVQAIEFSAYEKMANQKLHDIREEAFDKFDLHCMHIYHSLGRVDLGEICFFVFVSSAHRKACFEAIEWLVNEIKAEVPIFGKELFTDGSHTWKENRND